MSSRVQLLIDNWVARARGVLSRVRDRRGSLGLAAGLAILTLVWLAGLLVSDTRSGSGPGLPSPPTSAITSQTTHATQTTLSPQTTPSPGDARDHQNAAPDRRTTLQLGVTFTRGGLDKWGDPRAVDRGRTLLRKTQLYQNQHVMGWGAENPEPSPGVFDWKSLDDRVATIRATNGTPVLTLCCAPDWMKGGAPGTTDWSRLVEGLQPEFYDDFADLAREVALRYPDVKHYLVWNELKGFWDSGLGRWGYETYTDLYNRVYVALKSVNPEIQVGGPYVVVDSTLSPQPTTSKSVSGSWGHADQRSLDVIDYWLEHAVGAEFVVIDASTKPRDADVSPDPFAATEKFSAIAAWVRQRTKLPLWWAEWYVAPSGPDPQRSAVAMQILLRMIETSDVALLWEPEISGSGAVPALLLALDVHSTSRWWTTHAIWGSVSPACCTVSGRHHPGVVVHRLRRARSVEVEGRRGVRQHVGIGTGPSPGRRGNPH